MGNVELVIARKGQRGYNPTWHEFSQRQKQIIRGYDVKDIRRSELRAIIKKAEQLGWAVIVDIVAEMYEAMVSDATPPKYSIEEALGVLQGLTPWER